MKSTKRNILYLIAASSIVLAGGFTRLSLPAQQGGGSDPPPQPVKLIFIHHSTGENWLTDGYGNLGLNLAENNYYVSDTNYGWGPNGIGDRTDIPDWLEWFRSGETARYMEALFSENGQHADYTRTLADPGGENQIIMFKSCFPNSDLEGNPDDPPSEDGWLSVGHAKYVYNEILDTFRDHPEKLFVVITAPPLSDRTHAANARAFNQWLVYDWLEENDYPYHNVAVFDFYNVLTAKDGHHSFENGQEVHQVPNRNTLYYPSGDDHPSEAGSQKATEEFIPLLNYFYNRWQLDEPAPLAPAAQDAGDAENVSALGISGLIDDFEGSQPPGSNGWEAFWDESTNSAVECEIDPGGGREGSGLHLSFDISPYSWGTCGLFYDLAQNWSEYQGLTLDLRSGQSGQNLHIDLYAEGPAGRESYFHELTLTSAMEQDWVPVQIPWDEFRRVDWEDAAGSAFSSPDRISGLAFGLAAEEGQETGQLWIDNLGWAGAPPESVPAAESDLEESSEPDQTRRGLPCLPAVALPLGLAGMIFWQKKRGIEP